MYDLDYEQSIMFVVWLHVDITFDGNKPEGIQTGGSLNFQLHVEMVASRNRHKDFEYSLLVNMIIMTRTNAVLMM